MLKIMDLDRLMTGPVQVSLEGASGVKRTVTPVDTGEDIDVIPGDGIFSAPVPGFADSTVKFKIRSGKLIWAGSFKLDPNDLKAAAIIKLGAGGEANTLSEAEAMALDKRTSVVPQPKADHRSPRDPGYQGGGSGAYPGRGEPGFSHRAKVGPGFVLWALLFVSFGLCLAVTLALFGRRSRGAALLDRPAPAGRVDPVRLDGSADEALNGPLAGHRVVLLGPQLKGHPDLISCLDQNPLPDELVTAVESLAVTEGPPVALLITDKELLDRPGQADPVSPLNRRVSGRFPLWVQQGPAEWSGWPKDATAPDPGGDEDQDG